jgi:hypothetical protein
MAEATALTDAGMKAALENSAAAQQQALLFQAELQTQSTLFNAKMAAIQAALGLSGKIAGR